MVDKLFHSSKLILTILFFLIIFGAYQYSTLPKESDPDISLPVIYISLAHKGISPSDSEIEHAKSIIKIFEESKAKGRGSTSLNGQVVDVPVVKRAEALLAQAEEIPAE